MSKFSINFDDEAQYKNFIQSIKDEVVKEMKPEPAYHPCWSGVRDQLEERFRNGFNDGCGQWHNNMQSMYAIFRLAFQQPTIKDLKNVDGNRIQELHDELIDLIDRYREEN